jgi:hypothetical protein
VTVKKDFFCTRRFAYCPDKVKDRQAFIARVISKSLTDDVIFKLVGGQGLEIVPEPGQTSWIRG